MNIVVCGDCFWVGLQNQLSVFKPETSGPLSQMVVINNLVLECCPQCGKSKIFRKLTDNQRNNVSEQPSSEFLHIAEEEALEDHDISSDIVADLLDSAEHGGSELKDSEDKNSKPLPKPNAPREKMRKYICDSCTKSFKSKYETNRCPNCDEAMLKKYVG